MKLTTKLAVLFILLSTVPLVVVSVLAYRSTNQALKAQTFHTLYTETSLRESQVMEWLNSGEWAVVGVAQNPQVKLYTAALIEGGPDAHVDAGPHSGSASEQLLPILRQQSELQTLFVMSAADGTVIASTDERLLDQSFAGEPFFEFGQQTASAYAPVYRDGGTGVTVPVSAPLMSEDGKALAVVAGYLNTAEFLFANDHPPHIVETEHTYLVDAAGRLMTYSAYHEGEPPGQNVSSKGITACLSGETVAGEYVDHDGVAVLGVYHWLDEPGICLVSEINRGEALAASVSLLWTILIIMTVVGLAASGLSIGFTGSLIDPIERLVEGAHRIGAGDLAHRVNIHQRKDELGVLAASFNNMAADLGDSQRALREARDELEQRVEERTEELQRANKNLLMEIDERQQAELALQQLNRAYRTLSYGNQAVAHAEDEQQLLKEVCRVAVDTGGYMLAWVGRVSDEDAGKLYPIVRYGAEASHLDHLTVTLDEDTVQGQGPIAKALRTGEPVIIYDVESDLIVRPWRRQMVEEGYTSIVVLPVKIEGELSDVLVLYTNGSEDVETQEVALLKDLADNLAYGIAALRSRAERDRTAQALVRSEERFRSLVQNGTDIISVLDTDGTTLYQSPAKRLHGYAQEEVLGTNVYDCVHPDDAQTLQQALALVIAEPAATFSAVLRMRHHDEGWRYVEMAGRNQISNPAVGGIVINARDVSKRVHREQALREQEQRFRKIFDEGPMGMAIVGLNGQFERVNSRLCEIVGYQAEELYSMTFMDITYPDDVEMSLKLAADLKKGKIPSYSFEKRYLCKDCTSLWVNLTVTMVRDDHGEPLYYLAMVKDIQQRKESEKKLNQYMDELKRSNDDLQQFAYIASHDLQEPLRMVSSYLQLLERRYKGQLDEDADDFIYYAVDGANRMKTLIEDLLSFSRVGTQGQPLTPVDSGDVLASVLDTMQLSIEESGASITCDPLPTVRGDARQLGQVFQNLLSNALKFAGDALPRVHVSAERADNMWQFTVRDNGIGFDAGQYGERVFVIFQRLHSRAAYEGTGIGLAMCKKIVERHGGRIWCESEPGNGAAFIFTLPAYEVITSD